MTQVSTQIGPFSIVPEWVLNKNLSPTALKLYCVLGRFADYETGMAFPSRDTLAERMGCSGKTIDRAVTELVAGKCIEKISRGRYQSALYKVLQVNPDWTHLSDEWTDLSDEGTDLSEREDKNDTITITNEREPLEREPTNKLFDQFWSVYPRKEAKAAARKRFEKVIKKHDVNVIIAGAISYRDDPNRTPKYTAQAARWLNEERWEDEPLPGDTRKLANWEKAVLLSQKYAEESHNEVEQVNRPVVRQIEAEASSWLKGVDDE